MGVQLIVYSQYNDEQFICDLYENEDLPLTLSVDEFKNVAEKLQSYSKAFNLPATKYNNRVFDDLFEITRSYDDIIFNPYRRSKCVLKQDGFILFEGYLRLLDISDKEGEVSYNVNLYSEVVDLADTLSDRTFNTLGFTELEHEYNLSNIQATWGDVPAGVTYLNSSTSGFRNSNTVKYPFVDWEHNYTVGNSGNPVLPNLESAFRPFINIKYLIDRIFEATDFTYNSDFFNTTDFGKLFMDFNWGGSTMIGVADSTNYTANYKYGTGAPFFNTDETWLTLGLIDNTVTGGIASSFTPPDYRDSGVDIYKIICSSDYQLYTIDYSWTFFNDLNTSSDTFQLRWVKWDVSAGSYSYPQYRNVFIAAGDSGIMAGNFSVSLMSGDRLYAQYRGTGPYAGNWAEVQTTPGGNYGITGSATFNISSTILTSSTLSTIRGDEKQWDFLKGILTMFNLVTMPDETSPNNIKIEPYADVFVNNTTEQLNWTDKIDVSEMKLEPLTDLNKNTLFKFTEDEDDYAFKQYKRSVGNHLYGSKKFEATDEFNILEGRKEIVVAPFAATVIKPLMSQYPDFITPAIYSYNSDDDTTSSFENKPRIMYWNGYKTLGVTTYSIPAQNGVSGNASEDSYLQFSHLSDIPIITSNPPAVTDTVDCHFGACQLIPDVLDIGLPTVNNLFNLYWLPYYNELYNPDTRIMTIKVNLSPADINKFMFTDSVFIKNRTFRVNRIDYKPNDLATVEFILIP